MSFKQARNVHLKLMAPADELALRAAAGADGHVVVAPTHVVDRRGEIVGYASIGSARMFFAWLDSQKLGAIESFAAWREAEQLLAKGGGGPVILPCTETSPLRPFVEKMGYQRLGEATLFVKQF